MSRPSVISVFAVEHPVAWWLVPLGLLLAVSPPSLRAADELWLEVRETAGIARGGCPVAHRLKLPRPVPRDTPFSLTDDQGAPLVAQFSPAGRPRSEHGWRILRGPADRMTPFALAPAEKDQLTAARRPEGWAHIMDRRRCLALAVDDFAKSADERLTLNANGDISLRREFSTRPGAPSRGTRRFRFWLHFVFFPPQQSAATSPRMMQTPPEVKVVPRS